MTTRYFKLVEIDRDSFVAATGEDLDCCQLVVNVGGSIYVAVDCEENGLEIDMETLNADDRG